MIGPFKTSIIEPFFKIDVGIGKQVRFTFSDILKTLQDDQR